MFRRKKNSNGSVNGNSQKEGVVYYDGSNMQQQQQQVLYQDDRHDPQTAYHGQQQQQQSGKKKKKGFGSRIRGTFKRKKRRGTNGDDSASVGSHDVSVYSYDEPQHGPQDYYDDDEEENTMEVPLNDLPNSALDPNIMSRIVEEEEEESDDGGDGDDDDKPNNGSRRNILKAKSNHMISKKARELPMDSMVDDGDASSRPSSTVSFKESSKKSSTTAAPPKSTPSMVSLDSGSLSLVVLLIDPTTLRFELLQLDFPKPTEASVSDILSQIQDPFWRPLPFVGVIDRRGNVFKIKKQSKSKSSKRSFFKKSKQSSRSEMSPSLEDVCANRLPRKSRQEPHRDVLVGILRDSTAEKTRQMARSILGENKVVSVLEKQGYSLVGWKRDKQREATLQQSRALSNNKHSKRSSLSRSIMALLVIAAVLAAMVYSGKISPATLDPRVWDLGSKFPSIPSLRDKVPDMAPLLDKVRSTAVKAIGKPKSEASTKQAMPIAAPLLSVATGAGTTNTKDDL